MPAEKTRKQLLAELSELRRRVAELTEMTERHRRVEEELREREKRFNDIAENALEWIWEVDASGKYIYASPVVTRILGYRPEEVLEKHFFDLFHPDDREESKKAAFAVFERKEAFRQFPNRNLHKDGSVVWLSTSGVPILDSDGELVGYRGADTDVTERRRIEEERRSFESRIQQAQRLESLGVLAGGIAHDFNNLLMGVLGNAGLALGALGEKAPARQHVERIEGAARRAANLTNQLLAYSGKGRFVVESMVLSEVIEEMGHLLDATISKHAFIKYDFPADLPQIRGDASQIRQVIMNLITNASDAIGQKSGVITITTGVVKADRAYLQETLTQEDLAEGYYVFVEVSDTGCGMDETTRARIFDPFFTTKLSGRGLGLAAVLGIVRGHQGAIRLYSKVGRGTTFKVLFPAIEEPVEVRPIRAVAGDPWRGEGLVLVVDDEELVRETVKMILEEAGLSTILARDGREALRLFEQHADEISLVVLDMTMPHMSGEATYVELRRIRPDVAVILSSGYNEQEAVSRFASKGLAGFIQKPYSPQALIDAVREVWAEAGSN